MTTVIITTTGFSQSYLLWLYKHLKLHQELSPQHISGCPKFILPISLWCYVLTDRAYMIWVQYSIAIIPAMSTVYYRICFFICGVIKHTPLTLTAISLWKHSSISFVMLSLVQSQFHTTWGLLTVSHYYNSLPLAKSSSHLTTCDSKAPNLCPSSPWCNFQ